MNTFTVESGKASFTRTVIFLMQTTGVALTAIVAVGTIGIIAIACLDALYNFFIGGGF